VGKVDEAQKCLDKAKAALGEEAPLLFSNNPLGIIRNGQACSLC
jgi:hypothetical protein